MNAHTNTLPAPPLNTKPLWGAIGVLGVAVVALGASLVYVQTRPVDGHTALATLAAPAPAEVAAASTQVTPTESLNAREDLLVPPARPAAAAPRASATSPVARAPASPRPVTAAATRAPVAQPTPAAAPAPAPAVVVAGNGGTTVTGAPSVVTDNGVLVSQPVQIAPQPVCSYCGTVEGVTPIQRNVPSGSGVGAVAGGVLGAVVGNQIGKGSGRALATVLGAVGGGLAGNSIEKNMKKETVYRVQIRMEDGTLRTLEQSSPATVGARVTLDGNRIVAPDQRAGAPAATPPAPQPMVVSTDPRDIDRR